MSSSFFVVLPIFALILAGWLARRGGALGPAAAREMNRFVVWLALPALLFDIMAGAAPEEVWRPDFMLAFGLGCGAVFLFTLWWRLRQGRHLADAAIDGLNASYANTGYVGFPLILAVAGEAGAGPTLIAAILTVSVLFAAAVMLIEFGLQTGGGSRLRIVLRTLKAVAKNPLVVAPALGALVMLSGFELPQPANRFLDLLGGAAAPCALVGLGLFLAEESARGKAEPREAARPERDGAALLIGLKLFAQPAATWVVAGPVLGLPPLLLNLAVLLAALPTGTGPFMLAEFYGREARLTSRVVLATTALSVLTLSAYLAAVW